MANLHGLLQLLHTMERQLSLSKYEWSLPQPRTCEEAVYYAIWHNEEITRHEVAALTGLTLNNVCGRVYELIDKGLVCAYKAEGERRERLVIRKWRV